ncbi:beta-class carbonic anhydrase [Candidatus Poriferisocius sp.]|uniref:beta-class carbonic anhydrase n=1 Tax=Candidatus Poriferisocius sp. TaxID=3101276 RepID=UPI003B5A327A
MSQPATPPVELDTSVLTCMDHRIDPVAILGLAEGQAHVFRNAGGYVTEDAIRSLCLSQQLADTERILVMHHTNCKASEDTAEGYRALVEAGTGTSPTWDVQPVIDPYERVRAALGQLRQSTLVNTARLEGYVYDVDDGSLTPVS